MTETAEEGPQKRRVRRSDGLPLTFVSLDRQIFSRSEIFQSEDGSYQVKVAPFESILFTAVQGLIAGSVVTLIFGWDKWGHDVLKYTVPALFWLAIIWVVAAESLKLWRHPLEP